MALKTYQYRLDGIDLTQLNIEVGSPVILAGASSVDVLIHLTVEERAASALHESMQKYHSARLIKEVRARTVPNLEVNNLVLTSPDGTKYMIKVADNGTLSTKLA